MSELSTGGGTLVSAVIPTHGRPGLVLVAIRSALQQTWRRMEIIVVIDGPDEETEARLATIGDQRVRVITLPQPVGGSAARNAGVQEARGEWVAFLDDDDEWFPEKIERQMEAAGDAGKRFPVITCRLVAQSTASSRVLPQRCWNGREPVGDYLFCRSELADPGGLMQTSTLLAPRDLLLAIPFREGLPMHQDWDWILRAAADARVEVVMLPEPLTIWRVEDERNRASRASDWRFSLRWIREMRPFISGRAFSSFVAVECVWRARDSGASIAERVRILRAFLLEGNQGLRSCLHFAVFALIPPRLRRAVSDFLRTITIRHRRDSDLSAQGLTLAYSRDESRRVLRRTSAAK